MTPAVARSRKAVTHLSTSAWVQEQRGDLGVVLVGWLGFLVCCFFLVLFCILVWFGGFWGDVFCLFVGFFACSGWCGNADEPAGPKPLSSPVIWKIPHNLSCWLILLGPSFLATRQKPRALQGKVAAEERLSGKSFPDTDSQILGNIPPQYPQSLTYEVGKFPPPPPTFISFSSMGAHWEKFQENKRNKTKRQN